MLNILEVVVVLLVITLAFFIHEMGHAITVVLRNKKAKAEIYLGSFSKEKKLKLSLGRITCYLTIAFSGICNVSNPEELPPSTNKQNLIFSAGGPIASLLGFVTLYFISYLISGVLGIIINRVAVMSLIVFFTSAIPFIYPSFLRHVGGLQNDGLKILNILKEIRKQQKVVS
ncbi:site-2 protease family protein [Bacillus sp. FJAT-22090]|uniref:site-2 protease family protein n=1 Tax=Bacillus sp. FJAT-22090 TaxID=1581038 RepID=UPI00164296AB|nr:site-2 protease family protein [Bacillus sp. FJAT-22090]